MYDGTILIVVWITFMVFCVVAVPIIIAIIAKNNEKNKQWNAPAQPGMPASALYSGPVSAIPQPAAVQTSCMDAAFVAILQKIKAGRSFSIFEDYAKCKSLLQDYTAGGYNKEKHLVLLAVEAGCPGEIIRSTDPEITKKKLVNKLHDDFSMEYTAAEQVITLLYRVYNQY